MTESSTTIQWRIFDPKLLPFETYYKPDDIVSFHESTILTTTTSSSLPVDSDVPKVNKNNIKTLLSIRDPKKNGRLLYRVIAPKDSNTKTVIVDIKNVTEEIDTTKSNNNIGQKRKRQNDDNVDRTVWAVNLMINNNNNDNNNNNEQKSDCPTPIDGSTKINLTTDQFQIIFGSTNNNNNNNNNNTIGKNPLEIITTPTTDYFRQIASKYCDISTNNKERIIEIGCSTGETSRLLWNRMGSMQSSSSSLQSSKTKSSSSSSLSSSSLWIGFDTSKQMIDTMQQKIQQQQKLQCQKQHDGISTIHMSCTCLNILANPGAALDTITKEFGAGSNQSSSSSLSSSSSSPTIIFLDIGGNRDEYTVLRMLSWILNQSTWNDLRLIVIKSEQLVETLLHKDCTYCDQQTGIIHDGIRFLQQRLNTLEQQMHSSTNTNPTNNETPSTDIHSVIKQGNVTDIMQQQYFPKHPLQAPKRYYNNNNDTNGENTLICRYHNYHKDGCKKYLDPSSHCPFDHDHCHLCLQQGHVALNCPTRQQI